jgi:2-(1,2-epoxy-1,2-dihydrophenyl)acetyl-CoA isomerase
MDRAAGLARQLADGPTGAFGGSKRLLEESWSVSLETQMALETRSISGRARTADAREGIRSFVEKRPPRFDGG